MRALLQRVSRASVTVNGEIAGQIGPGLLVLVCAMQGDSDIEAEKLADKVSKLRIFSDAEGKMNRSVTDISGEALVVSQFTLSADTGRGNRPGFSGAASHEEGKRLYSLFSEKLAACGIPIETGIFGANMKVELVNDGPVTIWIET
ncbi:MAG: D-aminoacyl-tRNA deacylase [Roseovarius sp.]|nr:D-aminoacyl-tRNA deacylase [Roseovarius sp.]MCY4315654.1 D-aminoacyl-tRNA deacylase [Roseovarius sp.]